MKGKDGELMLLGLSYGVGDTPTRVPVGVLGMDTLSSDNDMVRNSWLDYVTLVIEIFVRDYCFKSKSIIIF